MMSVAINRRKKIIITVLLNTNHLIQNLLIDILDEELGENIIPRQTVIRIKNYVEDVIPHMTDKQFQTHFRINRQTYYTLLGLLSNIIRKETVCGRSLIDIERQLLSTLWLLATPDSYRSISERFNMGKSSLSDSFFRIIKGLNQVASEIIKWPEPEQRGQIKLKFSNMGGINGVIGVVDGTYIPIKAPKVDPEVYVTRKCQHAITLQAICDSSLLFIDCFVGYPGSVSDCRILRNSDIYQNIQQNKIAYFQNNEYILGDKAYPISSWCIPPYIERGNIGEAKKHFNTIHSQTRQTIERAFALLFGRFRRLKYLDMNRVDFIPATVLAACVLHNLCIQQNDIIDDYIAEGRAQVQGGVDVEDDRQHLEFGGVEMRDAICRDLFNIM